MQEREILFRGKRKDNGEWVYGDLLREKDIFGEIRTRIFVVTGKGNYTKEEVIPETRGEYTGLTDKNGKKVFEGDILYDEYNECNCLVTFDEGSFCLVTDNVCQSVWSCDMTAFEVIGNIHDNPELIKE